MVICNPGILYYMLQSLEQPKPEMLERAYVMITCESDCEQLVTEQLKSLEGVKEIAGTVGSYDIITKIEAPTTESLRELISLGIRKISKIRTTTTVVCEPHL